MTIWLFGSLRLSPEFLENLDAIGTGHLHIEYQQVRFSFPNGVDRFGAIACDLDMMTRCLQDIPV